MKWQVSKDNIIFFIVIAILVGLLLITTVWDWVDYDIPPVEEIDSTIIHYHVIDSIEYNIIRKDSVITEITYIYEEEIIKANNLDDSSAVELFKDLCTGHSLYGVGK